MLHTSWCTPPEAGVNQLAPKLESGLGLCRAESEGLAYSVQLHTKGPWCASRVCELCVLKGSKAMKGAGSCT